MLKPEKPEAKPWRPNILMFGASGTGKTKTWLDLAKLTGAKCLAIDTHHGTDAWAGLYAEDYQVVHTASPPEIESQVDHYLEHPDGFSMFVLDDISVSHTALQDMADDELRPGKPKAGQFSGVLDPGARSIIKRLAHVTLNKLVHLDMARIVVARSKPHYEASSRGGTFTLERKGTTFAGDKDMEYDFDLVLQLEKYGTRRVAVVEKARGMPDFPSTIEDFTAEKLLALLPCGPTGFTDPSRPNPVVTEAQADELRQLFMVAQLAPGRQSKALAHHGAQSIDDLPRVAFTKLVSQLQRAISQKQGG